MVLEIPSVPVDFLFFLDFIQDFILSDVARSILSWLFCSKVIWPGRFKFGC